MCRPRAINSLATDRHGGSPDSTVQGRHISVHGNTHNGGLKPEIAFCDGGEHASRTVLACKLRPKVMRNSVVYTYRAGGLNFALRCAYSL